MNLKPSKYDLAATVLIVLGTVYWIAFCVNNFNTYREWTDLSIFNYDFFYHVHYPGALSGLQYLVFGNHIAPIQLLVLPFYALFQSPLTLLTIQVLVLATLTGIAVYFISKDLLKNEFLALAICFAYLFNPGMHGSFIFDYHVEYFMPIFFLLVFYFYMKNNRNLFVLSLVLLLLVMESTPYLALVLGLAMFVYEYKYDKNLDQNLKRQRYMFIGLLVAGSIIAFIAYNLLTNVIISSYATNSQVPPLLRLFQQFGITQGYITSFLSNPLSAIGKLNNLYVDFGLIAIILGFGITVFIAPEPLFLLLLPWLAFGFLGNDQFFYVNFQYEAFALGGIVASAILSLLILQNSGSRPKLQRFSPHIIVAVSLFIFLLSLMATASTLAYTVNVQQEFLFAPVQYQNQFSQLNSMISLVPQNASVDTMDYALSHFPQRMYLNAINAKQWFLPQYILFDFNTAITSDAGDEANYQSLLNLTLAGNYSEIAQNGSTFIYKQQVAPPGPYLQLGEVKHIMGILTLYNLTVYNTPEALNSLYGDYTGYTGSNITEAWRMSYSHYPVWLLPSQYQDYNISLTETIFETTDPDYLYNRMAKSSVNVTNATLDGMTYSIENKSIGNQTIENLYGIENGKVAVATISTVAGYRRLNNTALIAYVAKDLQ